MIYFEETNDVINNRWINVIVTFFKNYDFCDKINNIFNISQYWLMSNYKWVINTKAVEVNLIIK